MLSTHLKHICTWISHDIISGPDSVPVVHLAMSAPLRAGHLEYTHVAVNPRTLKYLQNCATGT